MRCTPDEYSDRLVGLVSANMRHERVSVWPANGLTKPSGTKLADQAIQIIIVLVGLCFCEL